MKNALHIPITLTTAMVVGLLLAPPAQASKTLTLKTAKAEGTIQREGKLVVVKWRTFLEGTTLNVVQAKLTDWPRASATVSGTKHIKAKANGEGQMVLFIERETPFFLPSVNFQVLAKSLREESGNIRVSWERLSGTAKVYERVWELSAQEQGVKGVLVEHRFKIEIPFDLPNLFVERRMKKQLQQDAEKVARLVGVMGKAPQ
jgi:hypothetical protein